MLQQEKLRELIFITLYSLGFQKGDPNELIASFQDEYKVTKSNAKKAVEQGLLIFEKEETLDEMIEETSDSFDLTRIQPVERAILRLIFFELFIEKSLSIPVAIAEGKRLARKFASDDAASFVHALIDKRLGE